MSKLPSAQCRFHAALLVFQKSDVVIYDNFFCVQFSRYILPSANTLQFLLKEPGSHLLSHAVSSIVPSAAQVLTIVFGMGTGVSPERIATRKVRYQDFTW